MPIMSDMCGVFFPMKVYCYVEFVSTWGIKPEWIDFSDLLHVELLKKHIE